VTSLFFLSILIGISAGVAVRFQRHRVGKERSLANWAALVLNSAVIVALAFAIGRHPERQNISEAWMVASAIGCLIALLVVGFARLRR
jgi:membrane protein DedA with SNARE-associated domain